MIVYIDIGNQTLCNLFTVMSICDIDDKKSLIKNLREENFEYKTVITIQYNIADNITFVVQPH